MDTPEGIRKEFLAESRENLDRAEADLLQLEKDPGSKAALDSVFRAFHTLKGTAGILGFTALESLAHHAEGLLNAVREGRVHFDRVVGDALLGASDAVRTVLSVIDRTGSEGNPDFGPIVSVLGRLQNGGQGRDEGASSRAGNGADSVETVSAAGLSDGTIRVAVGHLDRLMNLVGELVLARNQIVQLGAVQKDSTLALAAQRLNLVMTHPL